MRALVLALMLAGCAPAPAGESPAPRQFESVATGQTCGGMAGVRCASADDFCDIPEANMCGAADGGGVCTPKPEVCTQEYEPVCGCGDVTYPNACMAAADGVSVAYRGECRI